MMSARGGDTSVTASAVLPLIALMKCTLTSNTMAHSLVVYQLLLGCAKSCLALGLWLI